MNIHILLRKYVDKGFEELSISGLGKPAVRHEEEVISFRLD